MKREVLKTYSGDGHFWVFERWDVGPFEGRLAITCDRDTGEQDILLLNPAKAEELLTILKEALG